MLRKSDPMRKGLAQECYGEQVLQRECMCCGGNYPYEHLSEPMQAKQKCHMCRITVGVPEEEGGETQGEALMLLGEEGTLEKMVDELQIERTEWGGAACFPCGFQATDDMI